MKRNKKEIVLVALVVALSGALVAALCRNPQHADVPAVAESEDGLVVLTQPKTISITIKTVRETVWQPREDFVPQDPDEYGFKPKREENSVQKTFCLKSGTVIAGFDALPFSLWKEPFVPPQIVEELYGWMSDGGYLTTAINLYDAVGSDRFSPSAYADMYAFGFYKDKEEAVVEGSEIRIGDSFFKYWHIGTTSSGVHIVGVAEGGGSGTFMEFLFLVFENDRTLYREPLINLKIVGRCGIGDRYSGDISFTNNVLTIPPDNGWEERVRITPYRECYTTQYVFE